MQRIAIIGPCGAGKSVLSAQLRRVTQLPLYHLDALYWRPGWVGRAEEEFIAMQKNVLAEERWIVDGNFLSTLSLRAAAADTIIFLDFPRRRYFPRIFRRIARYYGKTRPDMGEGCNERLDLEFVRYVWRFGERSRPRILEVLQRYEGTFTLHVLKSPREVKNFLCRLGEEKSQTKA